MLDRISKWQGMACLILCLTASPLLAVESVLTGSGTHLPIPVPNPGFPDRVVPVYSGVGTYTGTWSAPAPPAWIGTFTGTGLPPGTSGPGAATFDYTGLSNGSLPVGSFFALGDLDGGSGPTESITLRAFDASHTPLSEWLNEPFGVGSAGSATDTPSWDWDPITSTYRFDGNVVPGNPSITVHMKSNQEIHFLEVSRASIGFGYAIDAPRKPLPGAVTVLQDCWTTNLTLDADIERELYSFGAADPIDFVWKHKILEACSAYTAMIRVYPCRDGKPIARGGDVVRTLRHEFGPILPSPTVPEQLLFLTLGPGNLPPGRYDWTLQTECDDTTGRIKPDGDIDDQCGMNPGLKPIILGPEPLERWDPDPGGSPPGRGPGEEGTTRGWCFDVTH